MMGIEKLTVVGVVAVAVVDSEHFEEFEENFVDLGKGC